VVVVGGGISGLAAAHRLVRRAAAAPGRHSYEVVVLEARNRAGGAIWTERHDGFTLEGGADSFITNKPAAIDLCRDLGLGDRLIETDASRRRSFVVRNGRLLPVPEGFVMLAPSRVWPVLLSPLFSIGGKFRFLMERFVPRRRDRVEESLAAFVRRRFGREILDRLVQPLVGGVYTADPNELSLEATLSQFPEMERRHGSLLRGTRRLVQRSGMIDRGTSGARFGLFLSLDEGMDLLPRTLAAALPEGSLRTSTAVRRVARSEREGGWRVELLDGTAIEAAAVVLAAEAHASARLIDPYDHELARLLRSIPYASSLVVNVAYRRDAVGHPLDGFGAVMPACEGRSILAVSFSSVKFPCRAPAGTALMRVFLAGALQPELFDLDDARVAELVERELKELLGIQGPPLLLEISRHARAMPQYTLGHLGRIADIRDRAGQHPGLFLTGNAFDGVGIPDCIRGAHVAADAAVGYLAAGPRTAAA
jgi:oxygen-dependent protoporphyrinogen oxidase